MADRLVDIGLFRTAIDAEQARSLLEDAGIRSCVEGEAAGTWWAGNATLSQIQLLVFEKDAERATALLEGMDEGSAEDSPDAPPADQSLPSPDARAEPPADGADDRIEDEEEDEPPTNADVEWARQTRRLARLSFLLFWCIFPAISRITSPPEGVKQSPEARRILREARWLVYGWPTSPSRPDPIGDTWALTCSATCRGIAP